MAQAMPVSFVLAKGESRTVTLTVCAPDIMFTQSHTLETGVTFCAEAVTAKGSASVGVGALTAPVALFGQRPHPQPVPVPQIGGGGAPSTRVVCIFLEVD
uniref:Uncharacterized protein n=1 Tax=Chlamydomonas euryale TaxID=1486919 RepID=A0A7R9V3X5_9CHLO|mmetsp:Transcript_14448/g.42097  ORF Transcript_14448/g.42097 Transcript_14448/m.42097 type:complete len:100 (+) Transcript_14448:101-400(+)